MRIENTDPDRHNSIEYPMEVGAPKFAPVPVLEEKDKAINIARAHANQEYERIMEQASVLMRQAKALRARLDATEMVHAAKFNFNPVYGKKYYLYQDEASGGYRLVQNSPNDWSCGIPAGWTYCQAVRKLGDSTWEVIEEQAGTAS
jgi:hypothetical protein